MADCTLCGGACCEAVTLVIPATNNDFQRFIELRSAPQIQTDGSIKRTFECPCQMLKGGRCAIYDDRPIGCRMFEPGGPNCQVTVQSRRTPEQARAILGE